MWLVFTIKAKKNSQLFFCLLRKMLRNLQLLCFSILLPTSREISMKEKVSIPHMKLSINSRSGRILKELQTVINGTCCIFWPAIGCCALQILVEISFSHVFARFWYQNYEKWSELKHFLGFFSNQKISLITNYSSF